MPAYPWQRQGFDPPMEFQSFAPVNPVRLPSGDTGWAVTGHRQARALLADPRLSADRLKAQVPAGRMNDPDATVPPGMFILQDPPEHTHYRRMLTGQFTVRRMQKLEPRVEQIVAEQLDALAAAGSPADLVTHFALPVPSLVICELLGVHYEDREHFQQLTKTMLAIDTTKEAGQSASAEIQAFLAGLVAQKRTRPDDAIISGLIQDTDLTDEELTNISVLLLIAGHETTANMLSLGTFALLQNPEQLRLLREKPELMPGAVEELLRYLSIVGSLGLSRLAIGDITIGEVTIRAGQTVLISLPAANRDPALTENPNDLDVSRPRASHVAFGHGIHQCLGQQLARTEMKIGYHHLLRRFPDLALACEPHEVPLRSDMRIYGAHALPVKW
ncbi:cytochrome P450 [Fodinicola feengrottensis]|uniref:Cytochrome P450 n=1 Tax=Fodinicola feengrottensis TaxID=435914 RepID=A0ABN2J865_9ACTN